MDASAHATFWHYLLAIPLLLVVGTAVHCFRSSFNIIPDRFNLTPHRPMLSSYLDDMLSTNYSFWDMVAGTEYDEDGFYEFFSLRNLRICCLWTVTLGMTALLGYPGLAQHYVSIINAAPGWLRDLIVHRIENLSLI